MGRLRCAITKPRGIRARKPWLRRPPNAPNNQSDTMRLCNPTLNSTSPKWGSSASKGRKRRTLWPEPLFRSHYCRWTRFTSRSPLEPPRCHDSGETHHSCGIIPHFPPTSYRILRQWDTVHRRSSSVVTAAILGSLAFRSKHDWASKLLTLQTTMDYSCTNRSRLACVLRCRMRVANVRLRRPCFIRSRDKGLTPHALVQGGLGQRSESVHRERMTQ